MIKRKWHILKEDSQRLVHLKEEPMIRQWHRHWQYAPTAALIMFIIQYARLADITEARWLS